MPLHCSSCHKPGHRFSDCAERESRIYWRCNTPGHLRARCPKNTHRLKRTQSDLSDTSGNGELQRPTSKNVYLFTNPTFSGVIHNVGPVSMPDCVQGGRNNKSLNVSMNCWVSVFQSGEKSVCMCCRPARTHFG
ncbi:hypothetical protein CLU79DRAFT_203510 [Phycomyces nitens]|nr:hypothetical protein CLU79DRAFT_203510 [Phycomyces nitens]